MTVHPLTSLLVTMLVITPSLGCAPTAVTGLRPTEPRAEWARSVSVETRRPDFRWDVFPTAADRDADSGIRRADNVRYDFRVWQADGDTGYPTRLVYRRDGLVEPGHHLEADLEPATWYVWSVRARFDLDGRPRVTPWSVLMPPGGRGVFDPVRAAAVPEVSYYRFKTPPS